MAKPARTDRGHVGLPKVPLASMPVIPPDHIAGLVSYLVKDEASFITGESGGASVVHSIYAVTQDNL